MAAASATPDVPSDLEIAQAAKMKPIMDIALEAGLLEDEVDLYGRYKAKVHFEEVLERLKDRPNGKLIVVTAITPTPLGEGNGSRTVPTASSSWSRQSHRRRWAKGKRSPTSASRRQSVSWAKTSSTHCGNPRWGPFSALRAVQPAEATPRSCRWRTSTSTLRATSTRSGRCSRRRLLPGRADGGPQPPLYGRHPRGRGRQ